MSAEHDTPYNAPQMPNYFELFQNILSPFTAGAGKIGDGLASNAAAVMKASIDPKEIAKKKREMEVVLMWLKAQVGVVELSIKTLEYQLSLVEQFSKAKAAVSSHIGSKASTGADLGGDADADKATKRDQNSKANAIPSLEELAKMASEMNPAAWAMKMIQEATSGKPAAATTTTAKSAVKPKTTPIKKTSTVKAKQTRKR